MSNKSKFDIFYKYLKCSLKTAKFAGMTHKNFIKQDTSSTQVLADNIDASVDTPAVAKKRDTVTISLQSPGKVLEATKT